VVAPVVTGVGNFMEVNRYQPNKCCRSDHDVVAVACSALGSIGMVVLLVALLCSTIILVTVALVFVFVDMLSIINTSM